MAETNECPVRINSIEWLETITNCMKDSGIIPKGSIIDLDYHLPYIPSSGIDNSRDCFLYTAYLEYISSQGFQAFKWYSSEEGVMKAYEFLQSLQKMEAGEITYFSLKVIIGDLVNPYDDFTFG